MLATALRDPVEPRVTRGTTSWDVIVVGAGPAGAVTAYSLARRGVSVLLLERQPFPRWKVCGACLSPGALAALDSVGLGDRIADLGAVPLERMSLSAGHRSVDIALRGSAALSRPVLDQALVEAAVDHGVVFQQSAHATLGEVEGRDRLMNVRREGVESLHRARVVIDATGLGGGLGSSARESSTVRRGSHETVSADSRVGLGATFGELQYDLGRGELRMVVGSMGYVGLVRVENGGLNVGAAIDPSALKGRSPGEAVREILSEAGQPHLNAYPSRGWRGTPALTRRRTDVGADRLFRVGDASGYVEPFTGEGICWALDSAVRVADLACAGVTEWSPDLLCAWRGYQTKSLARSQRLCRALAWALRRPTLMRSAVGLLERIPVLAQPFVRGVGARPRRAGTEAA